MIENKFLYQNVKGWILKDIEDGKYNPNDLIPNEKQLCDMYDVSMITIRRALEDLSKEGVIQKIKGKGSIVTGRDAIGQQVSLNSQGGSHKVGVLMVGIKQGLYPIHLDYTNNWSSKIIYGMKRSIGNHDLYIAGLPTDQIVERLPFLPINKVDRVVLLGGWDVELVKYFEDQGKQIILYNNFEEGLDIPSVNNNERESCHQAIQHLNQLGHRKIAVINGFYNFSESKERYFGFQQALYENSIDILPFFVKWGDYTPESGYYLMKELLEGPSRPTAVFCANDTVAAGALHALLEAGLKCPDDVSLIGHDNLDFSENLGPGLSTIDPNFDEVGYHLGRLLVSNDLRMKRIVVKNEIIYRNSLFVLSEEKQSMKQS